MSFVRWTIITNFVQSPNPCDIRLNILVLKRTSVMSFGCHEMQLK